MHFLYIFYICIDAVYRKTERERRICVCGCYWVPFVGALLHWLTVNHSVQFHFFLLGILISFDIFPYTTNNCCYFLWIWKMMHAILFFWVRGICFRLLKKSFTTVVNYYYFRKGCNWLPWVLQFWWSYKGIWNFHSLLSDCFQCQKGNMST